VTEEELRSIKSSYNTYVPEVVSGKIDCKRRVSKNSPSHSHVMNLIEQVMDVKDAINFRHQFISLKEACASSTSKSSPREWSFPAEAPSFLDPSIWQKFLGRYAVKTPLWAIQHCLSSMQLSGKTYSVEVSDSLELSTAADGAFVICGVINPECVPQDGRCFCGEHPHDPSYEIISPNCRQKKVPSVVLFIPSTGSYYSPRFVSNTSRLQSRGLWLGDCRLANSTTLQMLPSTSLRIAKADGLPGAGGQLLSFTDIYRINVTSNVDPIVSLLPILHGVHVDDNDICIPHDVIIGKEECLVDFSGNVRKCNMWLRRMFVEELAISSSF